MVLTLIYSPASDGVDLKPRFQNCEGWKQDLLKEGEKPARTTTIFFLLESREGWGNLVSEIIDKSSFSY